LKHWVPHRIFAPGTTPAYSNYGAALAGYIVQRVSHEPFDDYVEHHIFAPLGMAHSTFRQPLPPQMRPAMATGYERASGKPVGYEYVGPAPAGALAATGDDMGRFMIAHLNDGAGLLRPETARMMHTTAWPTVGPLHHMLLGFYQTDINGHRAIGHAGDTTGFHSDLRLFLDDHVGVFVSFNSGGREGAAHNLRGALMDGFADRYFPGQPDTRRVPDATAAEHARMLAGTWISSRGAFSNFMNVVELLGQTKVGVDAHGRVVMPFLPGVNGQPRRWVEVEPFVWQDLNSHERMAARVENGEITRFSVDTVSPFTVFDRAPWYRSSSWLIPALVAALLILAITAIFWPVRALVRRRFGATLALEKNALLSYRLVRGASWLILLVVIGWVFALSKMLGDFNNLSAGFDPVIWTLQILGFLAFLGGFAVILWDGWLVWRGGRGWKARLWSLALVFAALMVVWIGFTFHLLSLGTNY
jgi:hypothetical protein